MSAAWLAAGSCGRCSVGCGAAGTSSRSALPALPTIAWRVLLAGGRWRRSLSLERVAVDERYPAPTLAADGVDGANLYRQNIARKLFRSRPAARSSVPVQLIIPAGDRFISESYYELAESRAPSLVRRTVPGSHWAPRSQPELVAQWIGEFALQTAADAAI